MPVVSISLPSKILEEMESLKEAEGYASRSELFRTAVRKYLNEYKLREKKAGVVSGFLSITYDIGDQSCSNKIKELHHKYEELVKSSLHLHLEEQTCYDVWVVKGKTGKVLQLTEQLKTIRGTKHVGHDLVSI